MEEAKVVDDASINRRTIDGLWPFERNLPVQMQTTGSGLNAQNVRRVDCRLNTPAEVVERVQQVSAGQWMIDPIDHVVKSGRDECPNDFVGALEKFVGPEAHGETNPFWVWLVRYVISEVVAPAFI